MKQVRNVKINPELFANLVFHVVSKLQTVQHCHFEDSDSDTLAHLGAEGWGGGGGGGGHSSSEGHL